MKLIDQLREQVAGLGMIKRAWFTTFNLGIPFFETHVLPALLSMEKPGNRTDYEDMQMQIAGIDVRVFSDLRAMDTYQLKRTAVHIHGMVPERINPDVFGKDSLFHPKVIFLEDELGRMVLGAGSANLTVSGWGRNQEAFTFRPISTNAQYQQVKRFFQALAQAAGIEEWMEMGVRRRFQEGDESWSFVHSFEQRSFLDQLLGADNIDSTDSLTVWSPYFARDLAGLLDNIQSAYGAGMKFRIVPDRAGNKRIRTVWTSQINAMLNGGSLAFHQSPSPRMQEIELTHAKLWLASGKRSARLAVGSWNCTKRGTASFDQPNVEAGFLFPVPPKTVIAGAELPLTSKHFSLIETLDSEQLELLDPPPFDLQVEFDWRHSRYRVEGRFLASGSREGYSLHLPGLEPEPLQWKDRIYNKAWPLVPLEHELRNDELLLANHCYEVWHGGRLMYRGLIQETSQDHRRAQGYDSLRDLLNDLIDGVKPGGSTTTRLRKTLRHNDVPEDAPPATDPAAEAAALSYFRVFQGFEQFRKRLGDAQDQSELHRILFVQAGSLQELVVQIDELVRATDNPVFNWFLLEELNALYAQADRKWDGRHTRPEKWHSLKPDRSAAKLPASIRGNTAYMRQLKEFYRHGT